MRDHLLGFFQPNDLTPRFSPWEKAEPKKKPKIGKACLADFDKDETAKLTPPASSCQETPKTFDPMTEPLQVGDLVEIVGYNEHWNGARGRVSGVFGVNIRFLPVGAKYGRHQTDGADFFRRRFKLIEKAQ